MNEFDYTSIMEYQTSVLNQCCDWCDWNFSETSWQVDCEILANYHWQIHGLVFAFATLGHKTLFDMRWREAHVIWDSLKEFECAQRAQQDCIIRELGRWQ